MADSSVAITAGSGTPIRVLTGLGAATADQQVVTLADSAGNLLGTPGAPLPVVLEDSTATISIAANATSSGQVTGLNGAGTTLIQLTGTFSATLQVQITVDGSTWINLTGSTQVMNHPTDAYIGSGNITATGIYKVDTTGVAGVRIITTTYTSGTVTGTVRVASASSNTTIHGTPAVTLGATSNVIGAVGIGATVSTGVFYVSTGTNAAVVAKAGAGSLQTLMISNTAASTQYVKLFNVTSATLGTTAAVVDIPVAAGATISVNLGANGQRFSTGIVYAITGAAGATNNTANTAGVYIALTYV